MFVKFSVLLNNVFEKGLRNLRCNHYAEKPHTTAIDVHTVATTTLAGTVCKHNVPPHTHEARGFELLSDITHSRAVARVVVGTFG